METLTFNNFVVQQMFISHEVNISYIAGTKHFCTDCQLFGGRPPNKLTWSTAASTPFELGLA
jgi:hypothetical protein